MGDVRGSRFTEEQIIAALARLESGEAAESICGDLGITPQTLYRWRWRFGGMDAGSAKLATELQRERTRLSTRVRELAQDVQVLRSILTRVMDEPAARRAAAEFAMREYGLSERHACRLLAVPRSTLRYRPRREKTDGAVSQRRTG